MSNSKSQLLFSRFIVVSALFPCCILFAADKPVSLPRLGDRLAGDQSETEVSSGSVFPTSELEAPWQRRRTRRSSRVYKSRISPHWFADNTHFWYRNDLSEGKREFIFVDVGKGERKAAFDNKRLAKALSDSGLKNVDPDRLPLDSLVFNIEQKSVTFLAGGSHWSCDLKTYQLTKLKVGKSVARRGLAPIPPTKAPRTSSPQGPETELTFVNQTKGEVEIFWLDTGGRRRSYGKLAAGKEKAQHTFSGHVWVILDKKGTVLAMFQAEENSNRAEITGRSGDYRRRRGQSSRRSRTAAAPAAAKWNSFIKDNNVFVKLPDGKEIQLSQDGTASYGYSMLQPSPDGSALVAFRVEPGERKEVHLVRSSPTGGGRATLRSRPYPLPGDKFTAYELNLFHIETKKQIKPKVGRIDFGRPRLRWNDDGHTFMYEKTDRGHQRFRVVEVDARTGNTRNLIDEKTDTFIWRAHGPGMPLTTYLKKTNEIIYASERDGWRHLYLVDEKKGEVTNQITKGEWVVRAIDRIDEDQRQIWFRASCLHSGQDPYLLHFCRVNFDGSGFVALTAGDGNHSIQYSPDRNYIIDTFTRIDMPAAHELRRVSDGKLVCALEQADISELKKSGWTSPEVFVAKGRDGKTDIWGIICRPRDFDPKKKYPIIEDIYAGPHGSFVPKTFSTSQRYESLTELGFIVVKIDGMGTANRSKAFHDVCWKNLKDAGFPDRILWMKAAQKKYSYMDLDRVGIYGTSAGGQSAAGAVLFHSEFYKAAFAACGCHDNRMDKSSWNEQWMGYPVGPHYSKSSNIDNAKRLQGHLLLLVGEMDTNVPPESTMRFVDALVKANKDFDLVVLPGAGHTSGGAYGRRRLHDFFARHLLGVNPPNRNASATPSTSSISPPTTSTTSTTSTSASQFDLQKLRPPRSEMAIVDSRYHADLASLNRFYTIRESVTRHVRLGQFYNGWLTALEKLKPESLSKDGLDERQRLREEIQKAVKQLSNDVQVRSRIAHLVPFAATIIKLAEARQRVDPLVASKAAGVLAKLGADIEATQESMGKRLESEHGQKSPLNQADMKHAIETINNMRSVLRNWFSFYDGYDPVFSWWMRDPYKKAIGALETYASFLKERIGKTSRTPVATTSSAIEFAPIDTSDVPDLASLLKIPRGPMIAIIEKYQTDRRQIMGRRRSRRSQNTADQVARYKSFCEKWLHALKQLEFKKMQMDDRIDYVLLKNHIQYQLDRIRIQASGAGIARSVPLDASGLTGYPIGRKALLLELSHEMIPYTPTELIAIAEKEYEWCEAELKKAAREMGFGDDWRKAVEKVKSMHVEPGRQPDMIRNLAWEAIDYLEKHKLVSIPKIARETWRMRMMTPERQLINPFFTGGEVISVAFPTDTMSHKDKLQSLRANNIPFARATVHHELIPGHHLQGFMTVRYRPHRSAFTTPFWGEGWALYWEMVLYDRGFPKTPEDRIGFLVWRSHRCARIIFSLGFHLGEMTPQECIDLLVARVGFERNSSVAEVRRSVGRGYSPLYQAAYMLGGLQIRQLRKELVDSGRMKERDFHDAILKHNRIPIELVRAILTDQNISADFKSTWRFYGNPLD